MFKRLSLAALALAVCFLSTASAEKLAIGDPAPALGVKQWVKGEPVAAFEKGKVYVVEFWATWCGPCKTSIPHVSELQKTYKDKGVTVIGVSILENDPTAVEPFVEKMGDKMAYRVATDDVPVEGSPREGKMAKTWMTASGQRGIPSAFVVDRDGKIAWIGHPMAMDKPLAEIVAGTYDVEAAKKMGALKARLTTAMEARDAKGAIAAIDEMVAADPKLEEEVGYTKFAIQLQEKQFDQAFAYAARLVDGVLKDDAQALNAIAWSIVDLEGVEKRDLPLALRAATRANELTGNKSAEVLDTLAKVQFDSGDPAKAIATQRRAVELAKGTQLEAELQKRLEQYEKEAAKDA
jgi:thiol-disulfide isomerase/thioredoxin